MVGHYRVGRALEQIIFANSANTAGSLALAARYGRLLRILMEHENSDRILSWS